MIWPRLAGRRLLCPILVEKRTVVAFADGAVFGPPRPWLRFEGATLLVGSLIAYSTTRQSWWLVPFTLLVPDVVMVGYLGGTRVMRPGFHDCSGY